MRVALAVVGFSIAVAYPLAIYAGLTHLNARSVALGLLAVAAPAFAWRFCSSRADHVRAIAPLPVLVISLLAVSAALDNELLLLALPVVINLVFLVGFAFSLRSDISFVERFARLQKPELSAAEVAYCRTVTVVWCVFFVANASIAAALAWVASREWWALYTGLISYLLMGVLFALEYIARKRRFREYGPHFYDRILARVFPSDRRD